LLLVSAAPTQGPTRFVYEPQHDRGADENRQSEWPRHPQQDEAAEEYRRDLTDRQDTEPDRPGQAGDVGGGDRQEHARRT
jgi:hypothetical protein